MITDGGTVIRTPVSEVPTYSRSAGGVILMRLGEGHSLVNFTKVPHEDPEEELPEEIAGETVVDETAAPAEVTGEVAEPAAETGNTEE